MEGLELPEFLEITQKEVILSYDGKKYFIKKPSALKLIDIHEAGQSIDTEKELRKLIQFQIDTLVSLGLDKVIAEALDLSSLKASFMALSQDPVKKK
jgi:hypothetical protein